MKKPNSKVLIDTVRTEAFTMDYARIGDGDKNFVIIPGMSIRKVTPAAQAVAAQYSLFSDYTIWLFDRKDNITEGYSVEDMARDTALAMQALGVGKSDLLGTSLGGMICQCLAADYPQLVNRMVLCSSLSRQNEMSLDSFKLWLDMARNRQECELVHSFGERVYSDAIWEKFGGTVVLANSNITPDEYERFVFTDLAAMNFDFFDRLHDIHCPVLVVGSEGDRALSPLGAKETAAELGCEIYMYSGEYGHAVYDEAPDFVEKCHNFFCR